jgi:hypothetical protein
MESQNFVKILSKTKNYIVKKNLEKYAELIQLRILRDPLDWPTFAVIVNSSEGDKIDYGWTNYPGCLGTLLIA